MNEILSQPPSTRAAPVDPSPVSTWKTPSGSPASRRTSSITSPEKGVNSDGLSTTAFPAMSACTVGLKDRMNGKFQGVMRPMTPIGR